MTEEIIVVEGSDSESYTCITSDARPFPWHGWLRAAHHCYQMKQFNFFVQMESAATCRHVAEAAAMQMKPPKQWVPEFGWGNFPHVGIDLRKKARRDA